MYYSKNFLIFLIFTTISVYLFNKINTSFTSSVNINEAETSTLQMVQIIIRHGDRAPIHTYPNDLYQNESLYWPEGWGQLTPIGIQQQYELGKYFRTRYDKFLPKKYSHLDFLAQSSDVDRAIQSAEANLRGLYPSKDLYSDNTFEWQVVPIHTIPTDNDIYLDVKREGCPKYMQKLAKYGAEISELMKTNPKFAEFLSSISKKAGLKNAAEVIALRDALFCEKAHDFPLPNWATEDVLIKLDTILATALKWLFQSEEMKRLRGGPLIEKVLENFQKKEKRNEAKISSTDSRKMHLFSGHDLTLTAVLSTWDIFDTHIPGYASALMIELHKKPEDIESNVQIYYRNETNREPYNLVIPKCGSPCLLSNLIEISNAYFPTDWEAECQLTSASPFVASDFEEDLISILVESLGFSNIS